MNVLNALSIRIRLLVVYVGVLLIAIGGFALIAGEQLVSGAQVDYEQRLQNETLLIAQGLGSVVYQYTNGQMEQSEFERVLQSYEAQVNGTLALYPASELAIYENDHGEVRDLVELKTALQGQTTLVQRQNDLGVDTFYTAAPVIYGQELLALIQLSVPARTLQQVITERWLELALLFAVVTGLAIFAALLLARSILLPLYRLRDSAQRLSKGDFAHRVTYTGNDEMSEFAHTFNEMAQQVETMIDAQRTFASNASHELRTPLTTIRQRTEALRYDTTLDEGKRKRYIEQIDEEVIRLGNLVEELTLLSRFESGHPEFGEEQVDLLRFATNIQQQMSALASDKHIQIALTLPENMTPLSARLDHLTVVFRNLIDNAIKYTPPYGRIEWNIEPSEWGINSQICDSGFGIDAIHLPHLFERFYRADKAHSRAIPGTGLGLALVKTIVEAYGGHVSIQSAGIDQGTRVSVFLPYSSHKSKRP